MNKNNKIFRTISNNYPQLDWNQNADQRDIFDIKRCHWGQLKLFYSELEFLTIVSKYYDHKECILVYVGSAPGHHIAYFRKLFQDLHMILYDPAPFIVKQDEYIEIHTKEEGYFTDETVAEVLKNPKIKGKHILFISDIRITDPDDRFERNVFNDMIKQKMGYKSW